MHQYSSYKQGLEMRNPALVLLDSWIGHKCLIPQSPYNPPLGPAHPQTVTAETPPCKSPQCWDSWFSQYFARQGVGRQQPLMACGALKECSFLSTRGSEMCYTWALFPWKTSWAHGTCGKIAWETKQSLIILVLHPYRHVLLPTPGPCTWTTTGLEFLLFLSA